MSQTLSVQRDVPDGALVTRIVVEFEDHPPEEFQAGVPITQKRNMLTDEEIPSHVTFQITLTPRRDT